MNEIKVLQEAIDCGILDLDSVHDELLATKKEKVKKLHPYAITPPSKEGGRWQTTYRDEKGNRKSIKAQSEEEIYDKLLPIYFSKSHIDKMTFHDLFEEWLVYKSGLVNSNNTIIRHRQHYKKYFLKSELDAKRISQVTDLMLETLCNGIVKSYNLSRKEWNNVKTILNGMFDYAIRKHYLTKNPMLNVSIYVKYRQVVHKTGKTETYNTEELTALNEYLDKQFCETGDPVFLAVKVNFLLGLRVGELVALKWDDILDDMKLHVVREEIRDQEKGVFEIVEHTKTNHDRFVVLIPKALDILKKITQKGEYIFMRGGERITSRQVAYVLEKYAERTGIRTKSTHKMRKTYASNLNANGVPLDCIREMLGHSELSTTLQYIYNPLTEKETYDLIKNAL